MEVARPHSEGVGGQEVAGDGGHNGDRGRDRGGDRGAGRVQGVGPRRALDGGARIERTTTTTTTAALAPSGLPSGDDAVVTSITDGDTVRVRTAAGANEPVRLIGIDTPETRDPRRPVECFGREATAAMTALLPVGAAVRLEYDVERRDRYDRVLAYVWRATDGLHVNEALVGGAGRRRSVFRRT